MTDRFKTSVVVLGERQVDEFQALCVYFGRRPHQLAADMVLSEIHRYRRHQKVAEFVAIMIGARKAYRAAHSAPSGTVSLAEYRRTRAR